METRKVILNLNEKDCQWLEKMYGDSWTKRMEQHIHNEIEMRRRDKKHPALKMREPWDY